MAGVASERLLHLIEGESTVSVFLLHPPILSLPIHPPIFLQPLLEGFITERGGITDTCLAVDVFVLVFVFEGLVIYRYWH
jgi:hypothetical protein